MKSFQFWILLLGSVLFSGLLIKQIFLDRALSRQERALTDARETAGTASAYENAWKQLAVQIYQVSHQDPALTDMLKAENIGIQANASSAPATNSAPASSKPSSAPTSP